MTRRPTHATAGLADPLPEKNRGRHIAHCAIDDRTDFAGSSESPPVIGSLHRTEAGPAAMTAASAALTACDVIGLFAPYSGGSAYEAVISEAVAALRTKFDKWGIYFDPLLGIYVAVRGRCEVVVATTDRELSEQLAGRS